MARRSKALLITVSIRYRAHKKVANVLALGGGFCWLLQFPLPLTIG